MKVGIAGPVRIEALLDLVPDGGTRLARGIARGSPPVTDLVRSLVELGHEVVVAACHEAVDEAEILSGPRLRVHVGPFRRHGRGRDLLRAERRHVERALEAECPDVVHAHWTYEYAWGALATERPTLVTVRDWAPAVLRHDPSPYRAVRLAMQGYTLRRGEWFTVTSPYLLDRVRRWTRGGLELVPNAVDDRMFSPEPWIAPTGSPVLVAINSGFGARKNVHSLLRAFPAVRRSQPGVRLRLVGRQYGKGEAAHRWAMERGLDKGVDFVGFVPNELVPGLLRSASLLVHPAREEAFGRVLVEALAQGLPVVAGRESGAVSWVLGEGEAGVLTDVESPAAIAASIERLLADPDLAGEIGRRGRARAEAFRQSRVTGQYLEIYRRILSQTRTD